MYHIPLFTPLSSTYASRQRQPRKHLTSISLVLVLHALLLWAISNGLAHKVVRFAENTVEAVLLSETAAPPSPAKAFPPSPKAQPTPAPSQSNLPTSTTPTPTTVPSSTTGPALTVTTPQSSSTTTAPVRSDAVGILCQKPAYPRASSRLEEEGEVSLSFVIGVDGAVAKVDVVKSSGFRRLDDAATQQIYKWRFKPAMSDGRAVEQTKTTKMKFTILNDHVPSDDNSAGC